MISWWQFWSTVEPDQCLIEVVRNDQQMCDEEAESLRER